MKPLIQILLVVFILAGGCQKEDKNTGSKSGFFRLTEIRNAGTKSTGNINDSIKTVFNLGDLKSSKDFYFILSNGGDNPIFDITLQTDNPQITVSPAEISILPGKDSAGGEDIIPLIALEAVHGMQLNGVGYARLLPMGENHITLTVTGKTLEDNDTITLSSEFSFRLNAKIMDVSLVYDGQEIDLVHPAGSMAGALNAGHIAFMPLYKFFSDSLEIQNTGNVEINLTIGELDPKGNYTESVMNPIPVNQFSRVPIKQFLSVLILNSNGTITDASRISLGNDGNGYIGIEKDAE